MKFKKTSRAAAPVFQMTALMDVVFLLLCFFVTTSVYSQWENEIAVALPQAGSATPPRRAPGEIVVNILADGSVSVNGAKRNDAELRAIFAKVSAYAPGTPVLVRADGKAEYAAVVHVIDMCRAAGISNFSLATGSEGH